MNLAETPKLRNRAQRIEFIQSFPRDLTSETRKDMQAILSEGSERYVIPFNDGHGLEVLLGVVAPGVLAERLEFFSGHEDAMAEMDAEFDAFDARHEHDTPSAPAGLITSYIWVDMGANFVLEPGDWHIVNTIPADRYLNGLTAAEVKQIADMLVDFLETCRRAAVAYARFCAQHALTHDWPDGEDGNPVDVVFDDPDAEGIAFVDGLRSFA